MQSTTHRGILMLRLLAQHIGILLSRHLGITAVLLLVAVGWSVNRQLAAPDAPPQAAVIPPPRAPAPAPKPTPLRKLFLTVSSEGSKVAITNTSQERYHDLLVRLVVGTDFNSYTFAMITPGGFGPGETFRLNLRNVTTFEGLRFDPDRYRATMVVEGHHEDGSEGTWEGRQ